jgi:hypothetical protein
VIEPIETAAADAVTSPRASASRTPLRPVANICASSSCPTVYESGPGTLVVQGYTVSAERAGIDLPDGETLVEIPVELLAEALRNLS